MILTETGLKDLVVIEPKVFGDERGYFFESFNEKLFQQFVCPVHFIQDNESKSNCGVLRGLHIQKPPYTQAKLVRVVLGEVLDVAVDLRTDSLSFGKYYSIVLSAENKKQFFIPRGFAHGFVVLSETAIFQYKVDNVYSPKNEIGIIYNDIDLNIDWNVETSMLKLSGKDTQLPQFKNIQFYNKAEYFNQ